jgi:CubicO group peptidase (beta-lactamase class C family)
MLQRSPHVDGLRRIGNGSGRPGPLSVVRSLRVAPRTIVLAAALAAVAPSGLSAEEAPSSPDSRLADAAALYDLWAGEQLAYNGVPGVVVGVVSGGRLAWAKGYGTTDVSGGSPLTPATP